MDVSCYREVIDLGDKARGLVRLWLGLTPKENCFSVVGPSYAGLLYRSRI